MKNKKRIEIIKQLRIAFFTSVTGFELMYNLSKIHGNHNDRSYMHKLHLEAKKEIFKDNPDLQKMDYLLELMENEAEKNTQQI